MAVNETALGRRISDIRNKEGLSQEAFAEKLFLSREYVAMIETGKRSPSLSSVIDIANTFHVSTDSILADSLEHPLSIEESEISHLLMECNPKESAIIIHMVKELVHILNELAI